ncbi:MAG: hypothetical protein N4A41_13445 [Crocinitomicaceae bacterium]|nr:hypothetical protein [Crocinitomicaceae bacterium]
MISGVRKPKIENFSSINKFLLKNNYPLRQSYVPTDTLFVDFVEEDNRNALANFHLIHHSGKKYTIKESLKQDCYGNIQDYVEKAGDTSIWIANGEVNIDHIFSNLNSTNETPFDRNELLNREWYFLIHWTKFMGVHTKTVLSFSKKLPQNIPFFYVNMDMQETMSTELKNALKYNYHKK